MIRESDQKKITFELLFYLQKMIKVCHISFNLAAHPAVLATFGCIRSLTHHHQSYLMPTS